MPELLIVGFKENVHRASGVLDELRVLDDKWIIELTDAVAVHRDGDGSVAMDQSYQPTGRRAVESEGALGLLIGASLSIPVIADASPIVAEGVITAAGLARVGIAGIDASFWTAMLGIPEEVLERISELVLPGSSAIYATLETSDATVPSIRFQSYGGTVVHLSLSSHQRMKIERLLREGDQLSKAVR